MGKYHCTIDLLFHWFGLVCFANKNKHCRCHTPNSEAVKQEVNGTGILPPLVFPAGANWGQLVEYLQTVRMSAQQ